jgi:predicted regulator of Ras-like GTPase activity (Roadblock/LC7/MglB family)
MSAPRGSLRKKQPAPARDQAASTFTEILQRLLDTTPGAQGVALVDFEGETVDYAGRLDPFELKVAAATWLIALSEVRDAKRLGEIRQIIVRARRAAYVLRRIDESYAVVVILHRRAAFVVSQRALEEADVKLSAEAGFPAPRYPARWFSVDVRAEPHDPRRPAALRVAGTFHPVEVMGAVMGLGPGEKGFRVRLPTGAEMMLVRERLGQWFSDEHVE